MLDSIARGRTKDLYGPKKIALPGVSQKIDGMLFRFVDTWSVPGWGRMQDVIPHRGICQALVHQTLHSLIQDRNAWQNYMRAPDSMAMRKGIASVNNSGGDSLSSLFGLIANELLTNGLRTHALGFVSEEEFQNSSESDALTPKTLPLHTRMTAIEWSEFEKQSSRSFLGKTFQDYSSFPKLRAPKILPFEFRLYFEAHKGSSLIERAERHADDLAHFAISKTASVASIRDGMSWDFPLIEMRGACDPYQRAWGPQEAMLVSGLTADALQNLSLVAAWTAGFVRYHVQRASLALTEITLRFGVDAQGNFVLMDSLSMDDLSLRVDQYHLTSEVLMNQYKGSTWLDEMKRSKKHGLNSGHPDFRKLCLEQPSPLKGDVKKAFQMAGEFIAQLIVRTSSAQPISGAADLGWKHDLKTLEPHLKILAGGF